MKAETLQAIKGRLDARTYSILCDDCDSIEAREKKRTANERLRDEILKCENPKLKMYAAILHAETSATKESLIKAAKAAAAMDDYITALYWHQKANLAPIDVDERFYRLKLNALASAQHKHNLEAKPITSHREMLAETELAKKLEDEEYLKLETECKVLENEYYKKDFDEIAETVILPREQKFQKAENAGFARLAIVWLAGIAWLIFSFPKVWVWANHFVSKFLPLLFILFWVIPIVYGIAVLIGIFMLGEAVAGKKSDNMSADIDKTIEYYITKIKQKLSETAQYEKLREMNAGLPEEFCNYDSRLILALLSRIYGEEDIKKVVKLYGKTVHQSWIERYAGEKQAGKHPYENVINGLLDNTYDIESIFLAIELAEKEEARAFRFDTEIEKAYHGIITPYHKKRQGVTALCYAFLHSEMESGENSGSDNQIGEVSYFLYVLSGRKDKKAGQTAVNCKNKKMLFSAMEAAIRNWSNSNFGFSRTDARKYIEELTIAGDPDGAKLRAILKDQLESEERDRIQDATIAAKEKERAEREEIARRWKAEEKADSFERDVNMFLHGDYSTEFERMVSGKMSYTDYTYSEEIRKKFTENE